jgi:hypothetical protein
MPVDTYSTPCKSTKGELMVTVIFPVKEVTEVAPTEATQDLVHDGGVLMDTTNDFLET